MNEIVKFHNDLTNEKLGKMKACELDLFITICAKMKDKSVQTVYIPFEELRKLGNYTQTSNKAIIKDLRGVKEKMIANFIITYIDDDGGEVTTTLFPELTTYEDCLKVTVAPQAEYILNNITGRFTLFELEEFVSLESKYSKRLYKLLKQYRTSGWCKMSKDEFYAKMGVPASYTNSNFNRLVLNPALKECSKYIKELKFDTKTSGRGGAIQSYTFTFCKEVDAEPTEPKQSRTEQAKESFTQNRKKSKNRFNDFEQRNDINFTDFEQMILSN